MKKNILAGLVGALFATAALAFDPFVVKDIRVEGIQRTEAGTVFSYLPVKVGDTLTDDVAAQAIKTLFATGFFKDVRLEIEGQVLVVVIEERPAIAAIDFVGMKAFKKEDVLKSLKDVGLAESRIFDRSLLDRAEQELKRQYLGFGHYAARVTTTVTPLERNRVGINFSIDEGEKAKIKQINIVGANAFKEADLLDLFALRTPNWLTWYTKNDQYSKQKLSGDLESLRSFYLDRGYLEFAVDSTQVSISPDKQDIYITISVNEGERYSISSVKLAGDLLLPEDELTKLVTVKPGDVYSREKMTETTKAIGERLGNEGYAFANVNAAPEIDKDKRQVAFTIFLDPGRRVHVRRINVAGNTRTRDEVIRREMRQLEGAWYEGDKINKSRTRVDNLGYFDEVTLETPAVPGVTDQVDVNVNVKEKPTGNIMVGAGFSSADKVSLSGSIQQENLFGSGKTVGIQLNTSKYYKTYAFSYTDPYYTIDGISRGFDIYHRTTNTAGLALGTYNASSMGGGVRWGLPLSEQDFVSLGLSIDATTLSLDSTSPQIWQDYVTTFGATSTTLLSSAGWMRNTIDSRLYPMKGSSYGVGGELSLPGGNVKYARLNLQHTRYIPMAKDQTLMLNAQIGEVVGYGGQPVPFTKNFYAGGIGSVRGFDSSSLGPVDPTTNGRLGGTRRITGSAEYLFPMPGMGKDKSVRLSGFVDAGQVWGYGSPVTLSDMRYSAGVGLAWSSPFGPLKFSFAKPLNAKPGDNIQHLQFTMGTAF
ncbi:MAG: outer membrane protein assembly factor BamA [Rhodocyclaceae bacterium]|nr:outer membrane protein assembly factor BamA [Rhodocyclaceae bacterium]